MNVENPKVNDGGSAHR